MEPADAEARLEVGEAPEHREDPVGHGRLKVEGRTPDFRSNRRAYFDPCA